MSETTPEQWVERLTGLGRAVRARVAEARGSERDLAVPVAEEGGDVIFAVDREVEPVIEAAVERWTGETHERITLVMEGLGASGERVYGGEPTASRRGLRQAWKLLIDPIDGTRNLMYDKRSAWFLATVAPDGGAGTTLDQSVAAVAVELPTTKAGYADTFSATSDGDAKAVRESLLDPHAEPVHIPLRPSQAPTLRHGFGQVVNFFPGTKVLAAELMERIAEASVGEPRPGGAEVYDDQYMTTGGQMIELITGRDRFCGDLRPLFYDIIGRKSAKPQAAVRGLECHPYDMGAWLIARRAGVILTDGFGRPLRPPMDVHTGVHWCGYANDHLYRQIQPVITRWLAERGLSI